VADYLRLAGVEFATYDHFYQQGEDFARVYADIAEDVLSLAASGQPVVYAVPGNPWVAEKTVDLICKLARERHLAVEVLHGMSSLEAVYGELGLDPTAGLAVLDALDGSDMQLNPGLPTLIAQVYNRFVAADLKLTLLEHYSPDHPVSVVTDAGTESVRQVTLPLHELDRREYGHAEMVYLPGFSAPPGPGLRLEELAGIMERLRDDGGCPWDQEQTHQSLRPYLIEETYEVLDALDAEDPAKLAEELGDLMLQIVFHAQIAAENGSFTLADPLRLICEKLVRRHPHVFADVMVSGSGEVLANWRQIKQGEREKDGSCPGNILDTVPRAFPALLEAAKVQARAREVGFDWPDMEGPLQKVREELAELLQAVAEKDAAGILEELGDLLFAVVNVSRFAGVEPENALRLATGKFRRRFAQVTDLAAQRGIDMNEATLAELDVLWDEAKEKR
jgi:tetrapyrrole methylase family protein/MazG family protein